MDQSSTKVTLCRAMPGAVVPAVGGGAQEGLAWGK